MQYYKYLICFSLFLLGMEKGFSQVFKAGDKVEVFINNTWKEARIVKAPAAKGILFEVEEITNIVQRQVKNNIKVSKQGMRAIKEPLLSSAKMVISAEKNLQLGKYDLYSGIPAMYIGHLLLAGDGIYKVAFSTDESNYEMGKYSFDATTDNIIWLTGLFKNKGWAGKVIITSATAWRIEFNTATYAENK